MNCFRSICRQKRHVVSRVLKCARLRKKIFYYTEITACQPFSLERVQYQIVHFSASYATSSFKKPAAGARGDTCDAWHRLAVTTVTEYVLFGRFVFRDLARFHLATWFPWPMLLYSIELQCRIQSASKFGDNMWKVVLLLDRYYLAASNC